MGNLNKSPWVIYMNCLSRLPDGSKLYDSLADYDFGVAFIGTSCLLHLVVKIVVSCNCCFWCDLLFYIVTLNLQFV